MLIRKANREDSDNTGSEQFNPGLCCLFRPFWQATSFQNFRTFTVLFLLSLL